MKGKVYLLLGFTLAGTSVITGYILSEKLGSFTITALSLGILLLCLLPFYGASVIKTIKILKKRDWQLLMLQSLLGIFLFRIFLLLGVARTSTLEAGILTGTTPAITSILAYLILKERFSPWTAMGIACTMLGTLLLQGDNLLSLQFSLQHLRGNLLVLCAATSEAAFNILSRKHRAMEQGDREGEIPPMVQTLLVAAMAFLLSILPALTESPFSALQRIGLKEWLALLWYGLFVTALAFVFFFKGVKGCDAYTTAAFSGMIPLTSMILSLVVLHEPINFPQWVGALLIISSMVLIGKGQGPTGEDTLTTPPANNQTEESCILN